MCWLELHKELQFKSFQCFVQWNGISLSLTSMFVFSMGIVAPNQCAINQYRSGFAWIKTSTVAGWAKCRPLWCFLLFQLCSALAGLWSDQWPCWYSAGLKLRQHSHLGFFPRTPFRGVNTAAKFTGVAPAGWPFRTRVPQQCLAASSLAMNIHARNMLLQSSKQVFLLHPPLCFALPEPIHLLFDCGVAWYLQSNSHWLADSSHQAVCSAAQDCLHQSALDKQVF